MQQEPYTLDSKSYKKLFNTFHMPLCLFANKYLDDLEISKDVVQDVFIKVWNKKIAYKNEAAIKTYLYTSVKNKSIDYLKNNNHRLKKELTPDIITKMEAESFFYREVLVVETKEIIENAVNTLPKRCKEIITMSLLGLNNKQISEELSISINTIKAQKRIAYKRLKPLLKEYFVLILYIFTSN